MMQVTTHDSSEVNPPRIEIKTLVGEAGQMDQQLADLLNAGWEQMNINWSSVATGIGEQSVRHYEFIKLMRRVEPEEPLVVTVTAEISLTPDPSPKGEGSQAAVEASLEKIKSMAAAMLKESPLVTPEEEEADEPQPVVVGTVFGMDLMPDREPVETVTFNKALRSGKYTPEELREIGDREVVAAGMRVAWQQQQYGANKWVGLVNRLPSAVMA